MARTKETKMFPEQQEKMTQEVMASLQPSTYGKDYAQKHSSFFEEVENSDLEVVTENVAATTSCMEDERTKLNHTLRRNQIQSVSYTQTLIQQLLGCGNIVVSTSATHRAALILHNVDQVMEIYSTINHNR